MSTTEKKIENAPASATLRNEAAAFGRTSIKDHDLAAKRFYVPHTHEEFVEPMPANKKPKTLGRPPKADEKKKNIIVGVRLDEEEHKRLLRYAIAKEEAPAAVARKALKAFLEDRGY